jgi:hypothetical protein
MNFDLLRILEPSKKAGVRIPARFLENAGSPGSAYNFKCVLLPASCFQIRNLGCCGFARKNAGSRKQGARPTFLNPASCKTPLSRWRGAWTPECHRSPVKRVACRPCHYARQAHQTRERDGKPLRTRGGMLCRPDQVGDPQVGLILFLRPSAPHTPLRIFLRWARYVGKMPLCPSTCHVRRDLPQRRACGSEASRAGHAMQTGVTDACGRRRSRRGVLDAPSSASALRRSEGVHDDGDSLERRQVSFGRAN